MFRHCITSLFCLLALAACDTPVHGPISSRDARRLQSQTLSAEEGAKKLRGPDALTISVEGPSKVMLPITWRGRCPYIPVGINGSRPTLLLLDTGAAISALEARTAIDHKLPLLDATTLPVKVEGIGGQEVMRAGFGEMSLGGWRMKNHPWLVRVHKTEMRMVGSLLKESLPVNLLGISPLSSFASYLTIDYPGNHVEVGTTEPFTPRAGSQAIPLVFVNRLPYVRLSSGNVSWLALLDSGSSFGLEVSRDIAEKLRLLESSVPVADDFQFGIGGKVDVQKADIRVAAMTNLDGLGERIPKAAVAIRPDRSLIGSYFLRHYRLTIDFKRQLLYLDR